MPATLKGPTALPKAAARGIPERIGKYMVIKEVGRGSTGVVYLSHDAYYGRDVAIKLYNMDPGADVVRDGAVMSFSHSGYDHFPTAT